MLEKNIKKIIIVLIVAIFLILGVGIILYFTTDLLKSKDALFKKYLAQNVKNIAEVVDFSEEKKDMDVLLKNNYLENTDISIKFLKNENDQEEVYKIKEEGIIKQENKNSYRNITAKYNDDVLANVLLLREDNMFGFKPSNLTDKYINVENASVAYLVASLGYNGNFFPEKFSFDNIVFSDLLKISDEEIEKLIETYSKVIFSEISKNSYSTKQNSMITLNNGKSITTKAYVLTLKKNEIDNIYKKVLNQAKSDKIILSKLDIIDEQIRNTGFKELEGTSLKERFIALIEDRLNKIEYQGEDNRQFVITVYELNGVTYRTSIKNDENEYLIDLDNNDLKTMSLKTIEYTEEGTNEKVYEVGKQKKQNGNDRVFKFNDGNVNLELITKLANDENNIKLDTELNYKSENIYDVTVSSSTNMDIGKKEIITETFEKNEKILINNYEDGDTIRAIFKQLQQIFINDLEKTQSKLNTKLLNDILVWIDDKEKQAAEELQKNIELQKQRFNNQFILYQGQELDYDHVNKFLSIVKNNMKDYQIVNNKKIKILIKKGEKNKEKFNQIKNAISKRNKYNIEINYSEDGYIESIDVSLFEKK